MKPIMKYLLQFVVFSLFSTVFGFVQISFMEGYPRLNNSAYYDYYFACHAEGEILQWIVNDSNISDYSGQSTLGSVLTYSISNCNTTTTLLTLMALPSGMSVFDSVLIISCQSSTSFDIVCTNGSISSKAENPEKSLTTMAENSSTSVNLELILNQNLVNTDSSICTNIFVCGVDNNLMTWQVQGNNPFTFTFHDTVGMKRQKLRGSIVEQQAILIDTKPYSLVVVLFMIDFPLVNVTCGYNGNTEGLSSMLCPTNLGTTELEAMDTSESKTIGSMISGSSTVGESSTMASGGSIILPLILGLSIPLGVLVALIIIIVIVYCYFQHYKERIKSDESMEMQFDTSVQPDGSRTSYKELPLKSNNFDGIIKAKPKMDNVDYEQKFFNRVQYIFLVRNEHTFHAATTTLTAPDIEKESNEATDIEKGSNEATDIGENVYIGMIDTHPVCLVYETGNQLLEKLEKVITKYFRKAKYLVFFGRYFGINHKEVKLGDIVISKSILHVSDKNFATTKLIPPEIRSVFCFDTEIKGLKVANGRFAKHFVCKIASGKNILNDEELRKQASIAHNDIKGYVETSGELFSLSKYQNITVRQMQAITIGAVTGYVDGDTVTMRGEWQFMASQAAFHYVASKMIHPHASGNISYDIKKTKLMKEKRKCSKLIEKVQFVILTVSSDEFNAVKTKLLKPGSEETIMEIDLDMLIDEKESHPSEIDLDIFIGEIGSHSIGLLYLKKPEDYVANMKYAIVKCFRHAKYLVHVGGISGIKKKSDLGDVLISNELCNIYYSKKSYSTKDIEVTQEIKEIFDNSNSPVIGLELPGSRRAKHSMVKIAIGTGANIEHNENMKKKAIESGRNYGYNVIGGYLVQLQGIMGLAKEDRRNIHFILVNGVRSYDDSRNYDEWDFVASQAAINYVAAKIEKHRQPIVG